MEQRKVVDLSQRRSELDRRRRKETLSRWMPAPWAIAWVVFLALAAIGFFWSGAAHRFAKPAPPSASSSAAPISP